MHTSLNESRILIVDDTLENIQILGEILKDYKRSVALNGEDALKIVWNNFKPDLILLDVVMPGMDGFEVCRRLKQNENSRDIPVIFITSRTDVEDETRGLELGAVDFIPKPISPPVVLARVKNHLELKMTRENLELNNLELAKRNKYITDSIYYAKRIQSAIFQSEEQFRKIVPEYFTLYFPKDIVSGDFYWFTEIDHLKIIAVIDCTGHGVPGAFMSIIGNTLLNEIVNIQKITDPGEVLNELNRRIINELQKDINKQTYDGMDVALVTYARAENTISFAGAYRPIIMCTDNNIIEIKGTKKSIGDAKKNITYQTHKEIINSETEIYLFSDGLTDQNNDKNEKYGSARLKSMIKNIHKEKMSRQRELLLEDFNKHHGQETLRDDILLVGIRIHNVQREKLIENRGPFNYDIILDICEKLKTDLEEKVTPKQSKLLFFCVHELLHNIVNYSGEDVCENNKTYKAGSIKAYLSQNEFEIETENPVAIDVFNNLKNRIDYLNKLNSEEINQLKKQVIKSEADSESKGGGIGFLEILRRTKTTIKVSSSVIDTKRCMIKFYLIITLGGLNE
jgi:phosphoserine phosphatase RsbU/P